MQDLALRQSEHALSPTYSTVLPSRALLAGGPDLEEEELEGFSLQALGEEEAETEDSMSEEEDGPGPPL